MSRLLHWFFAAAAAGPVSIAVPLGSIAMTGASPVIAIGITGSAGSLAITGVSPVSGIGITGSAGSAEITGETPFFDIGITGSAGSAEITGETPVVTPTVNVFIPVGEGSVSLTGVAPAVEVSAAGGYYSPFAVWLGTAGADPTAPGNGSVTMTGVNPLVIVSGNSGFRSIGGFWTGGAGYPPGASSTISPPCGTAAVTGATPLVTAGTVITVPLGCRIHAFWTANTEPDLSGYRLYLGTYSGGSDVLNGLDVGNVTEYLITGIGPGTYYLSVTAYDTEGAESPHSSEVYDVAVGLYLRTTTPVVNISEELGITPPTASLTITGAVPVTTLGVVGVKGSLAFTGGAVSLDYGYTVPVGSLLLTGTEPPVIISGQYTLPIGIGSLALTGVAPTLVLGTVIAPDPGTVTITGETPVIAVQAGFVIAVPIGTAAITGNVPTIYLTLRVVVDVPAGSLTLTGIQPSPIYTRSVPIGSLTLTGIAPLLSIVWVDPYAGIWQPPYTGFEPGKTFAVIADWITPQALISDSVSYVVIDAFRPYATFDEASELLRRGGPQFMSYTQNLVMDRGDEPTWPATAYQSDGITPYNLTGCKLYFTAKESTAYEDARAVFQKSSPSTGITITNAAAGTLTITLLAADTNTLPPKKMRLEYDLQAVTSGGTVITLTRGILVVRPDVTRAEA